MSAADYLLFRAAGRPLAVPSTQVQAIHDDIVTERVPGTHGWFLGLAVVDGQLLPVTDLGTFLAGDGADGDRSTVATCLLQLRPGIGHAGLAIDGVHGVSAWSGSGAVAALDEEGIPQDGERWRLLDLPALLQSRRFVAIGEVSA